MATRPPPTVKPLPTVPAAPLSPVSGGGVIGIGLACFVAGAIVTLWVKYGGAKAPGMPTGSFFTDTVTYIPHILILFGIFADIFTLRGSYSIASMFGVASVPIHYLLQFLWWAVSDFVQKTFKLAMTTPEPTSVASVVAPTVTAAINTATAARKTREATAAAALPQSGGRITNYDGCEVQGFEWMKSPYAPQGLVVTATMFWYFVLDLMVNRDPLDSVAAWLTFIAVFGAQMSVLRTECDELNADFSTFVIKSIVALAEGLLIGGSGFGIVYTTRPDLLPSAALPQGVPVSSLTTDPKTGNYVDSKGNQYIAGPDGRAIPLNFVLGGTSP